MDLLNTHWYLSMFLLLLLFVVVVVVVFVVVVVVFRILFNPVIFHHEFNKTFSQIIKRYLEILTTIKN